MELELIAGRSFNEDDAIDATAKEKKSGGIIVST